VTWPIASDNAPIASGLKPEQGATLNVYNYTDYLDPAAMKSFQARYKASGVKVKLTTFNDIPEALAKIRSGDVPFDVFIGSSYDTIGKMVLAGLVRPLNHIYIPNIKNVWPEFTNPFYDGGWRYTVPYTIYTTGIAWRTDMVKEDIAKLPNPWDVFWDPQFQGKISVLDDYRETPSMVLLREGNPDVNTGDDAALAKVQADLLAMTKATKPKITINHYSELPEASTRSPLLVRRRGQHAVLPAQGRRPGHPAVLVPGDGKGLVNNDLVLVLRNGKNPVLSHLFLNHLLDTDVSLGNFGATGYQPPQVSLTPSELVDQEYVPSNLSSRSSCPSSSRPATGRSSCPQPWTPSGRPSGSGSRPEPEMSTSEPGRSPPAGLARLRKSRAGPGRGAPSRRRSVPRAGRWPVTPGEARSSGPC
jgi:spermidine/putrescine transport system substrate-binding protein